MTDVWLDSYDASEDWFLYSKNVIGTGGDGGYTGKGLKDVFNRALRTLDTEPSIYPVRLKITEVPSPSSLVLFKYKTILIL